MTGSAIFKRQISIDDIYGIMIIILVINNSNYNNLYLYGIKLVQLAQKLLSIKVLLRLKVKEIKIYHFTRSSLKTSI